MDPELMRFLLYVLAKFLAYAIWCGFGIRLLWASDAAVSQELLAGTGRSPQKVWLFGAGYGLLRLLMGVIFGIVIWIVGSMVAGAMFSAPGRDVMTYLVVYVPVRWLEWSILAWIMASHSATSIGYSWRLGGIFISCLADIPIIAMSDWKLPIGRFFC